jgi:hypothetical protein
MGGINTRKKRLKCMKKENIKKEKRKYEKRQYE